MMCLGQLGWAERSGCGVLVAAWRTSSLAVETTARPRDRLPTNTAAGGGYCPSWMFMGSSSADDGGEVVVDAGSRIK